MDEWRDTMECNCNKILRHNEVCEMFKRDRTTILRWRQSGKFPKPIEDPGGELMWRKSVIEDWLTEIEAKSTRY